MAQQERLHPPGQLAMCRPTNVGKVSVKSTVSGRSQHSACGSKQQQLKSAVCFS